MRFQRFLLTTCAAVCLTWPVAVLADQPGDHGSQGDQGDQKDKKDDQGKDQNGGKAEKPNKGDQGKHQDKKAGPDSGAAAPDRDQAGAQGDQAGHNGGQDNQGARGGQPGGGNNSSARGGSQGAATTDAGPPRGRADTAAAPPARTQSAHRAPPPLTGWNHNATGPQRVQQGQQWRSQHHDWDQSAPWRSDRNWWRNDPGFRLFEGVRVGFYFFPSFGYVSVPDEYRDRHWNPGDNLPNFFWRYAVNDYDNYGLPEPPDGCEWVWLNGSVALIDLSDGYIIDIVYNVW